MKAIVSKLLRQANLLFFADELRFYIHKNRNRNRNRAFRLQHPDFRFPPDYLIYESFNMSYESYYKSGKAAAQSFVDIYKKYSSEKNPKILDWGCGPARVVRHIPALIQDSRVYGTDYNKDSIQWNKKNIENIDFNLNELKASLPYESEFFDFIYGISIFTHLSEKMHYDWKNELTRVLKKGGILLLSMQGNSFKMILTKNEIKEFEKGNIVVRGKVKEGHRTYSAFHPDRYVQELFADYDVLEHRESFSNNGKQEQDMWVLCKK